MLRRYCPPTSNNALLICPSEQMRTASTSTSKTLPSAITVCFRRCSIAADCGAFLARNAPQSAAMLQRLKQTVIADGNVFEVLVDAVRICSLGQISSALFEVGGQYRRSM